jgi:hypothetical protein
MCLVKNERELIEWGEKGKTLLEVSRVGEHSWALILMQWQI